ncbi:RagB/SusD family nutrient uptake outer membrane protein [Pedobacter montanisoli]|uniref:RagB/SusD family nutrient uptake outer membrane protein n=1 Tax=Pedobacter montanisoli TaxID=2923277 RepID=A0ABS9ZTG5_9SPHI|nr:RagB/SusD family nutrient uptake outer membrane protein [Pedobacter montanisoli]MCJ0741895.1 RagB/SusD family nutrient uptake outer membrane protein [Pedobacter montanisoli]
MKIFKISFLLSIFLLVGACKKLDLGPADQFEDSNFWTNENNVRTYSWEFYNLFTGFGTGTTADFYFSAFSDDQATTGFSNFAVSAPATNSNWSWYYIRKANILIDRVDKIASLSQEAKNHWKGVGRFFRAMDYFNKVKLFGGVPWIDSELDIAQNDLIYKKRDTRKFVMDKVMEDLDFAIANLRDNNLNEVNKSVALALKSRVALFEGTYRKYHTELGLQADAEAYLKAAKQASEALMTGKYILTTQYGPVYNSMDLKGNTEVILYKEYVAGTLTHSVIGYTASTTTMHGLTKSAVESYVYTDGLPVGQSPLATGDATITAVRKDRDDRLLKTISDFLCYQGNLSPQGFSSSTGYRPAKFLNSVSNQLAPYNETDAPIFWLAEVLLNYAEASAELNDLGVYTLTQNDLDKSVNKLRQRANVKPLILSGTNVMSGIAGDVIINDPKRTADISPIIWEIRRERRTELMMDGFRYNDLMRWKKGEYLDTTLNPDCILGANVPNNGKVTRNAAGYIMPYTATTVRKFISPKHYLSPIPTGQISLYPNNNLEQNPDWN